MAIEENPVAQHLFESFVRLRKVQWINWNQVGLPKSSDIRVLFCIAEGAQSDSSGVMVSEISHCLQVTSPTVTQLIKDLEAIGLVRRAIDESDRRIIRVRLTKEGEVIVTKAKAIVYETFHGLTEYLGDADSEQLTSLLSRVFMYYSDCQPKFTRGDV